MGTAEAMFDGAAGLLDALDGPDVDNWKPEAAGDTLAGEVVAAYTTTSDYTTDPIPVLEVRADDGSVSAVRAYHSVLRRELEKFSVGVGDTVAIRYQGKRDTKDGKGSYHAYRVAHARAAQVTPATQDGTRPTPF